MLIPYSATIQNSPDGPALEIECTVEATLEWIHGEPVAVITDVLIDGKTIWRGEGTLFALMAIQVAEKAEDDDSVLTALLAAEGVYLAGTMTPTPQWRAA